MKYVALIFALSALSPVSAFASTPYFSLTCRSDNHEVFADVMAGVDDCSKSFHVYGGNISETKIDQTSTCDATAPLVYTEGSVLAKTIAVSMGEGNTSMHLYSLEDVQTKPSRKRFFTDIELFRAKLVYSKMENGKKIVFTSNVNCSGSSFDNP